MADADDMRNIISLAAMPARRPGEIPPDAEESIALEFARRHEAELRFVAAWHQWLLYDGQRWQFDRTLDAFDRARALCREIAGAAAINRSRIASAKTVAAVERLARSDRRLAATTEQWDADLWLLNTPGGMLDLRTGRLREHRRADYATKITAVAPGDDCRQWLAFLDRITAGDRELQAFLQRVCGYALTGSTREHALFFFFGTGANGKSVLLSTISGILADYAAIAPIETFTASQTERHPTDLAGLRGARLVTAIETEEGRRWAEAKISALTGGDKIAARFMRQDFFEYTPQFKLLIAGNHRPGLRSVNEAVRRRFHLVPFAVTIPPEERDKELVERLKAEWSGILQWMVDGCLAWQQQGLAPPAAVLKATASYLEAQDAVRQWLDECTRPCPGEWEKSADMFQCWELWAKEQGIDVGTQRRLADRLEIHGIVSERRFVGRGYEGCIIHDEWREKVKAERLRRRPNALSWTASETA